VKRSLHPRIEAKIAGAVWETVLSLQPDELAKTLQSSVKESQPDNEAIKTAAVRS
jgi:hypothetical protein